MNMIKNKMVSVILSVLLFATATFALSAPTHLGAKANPQKDSVLISWSAVSGAAGYNIYRADAAGGGFKKINNSLLAKLVFEDKAAAKGKSFEYIVKAVDAGGEESVASAGAGAPLMNINSSVKITTLRDKPMTARSIKTGRIKTFAAPGDILTYSIVYSNDGFSDAKNVMIGYDIPSGTIIAGRPIVKQGKQADVSYFDRVANEWVKKIIKAENISKVRFLIPGVIEPVPNSRQVNGIIDLNVIIGI